MRDSIKRLKPDIHVSKNGKRYASCALGKLSRVEEGGYKLEGSIFATSKIDRIGLHRVIDQLMDRLDQTLDQSEAREEWPEWVEHDPAELRSMYAKAPANLRLALNLLADNARKSVTYGDIDARLDWQPGRFQSVFGGWRSRRGTWSPRPFHICSPARSESGQWEAWVDEAQATLLRGN